MRGSAVLGRRFGNEADGWLPKFVTAGTVQDRRDQIGTRVSVLTAEIEKCGSGLPAATRVAWDAWREGWGVVARSENGFWTAGANYDALDAWDRESIDWQAKIIALCAIDAPGFGPGPETSLGGALGGAEGLLKWGLLAFVVVKAWPLVAGVLEARRAKSAAK